MQEKMPDLVSWLEYNEIVRKMFGTKKKDFSFITTMLRRMDLVSEGFLLLK